MIRKNLKKNPENQREEEHSDLMVDFWEKGPLDAIKVIVKTDKEVEIGEHLFICATITLQAPETLGQSLGKAIRA